MRYLIAKQLFLKSMGKLTHDEKLRAVKAFDNTLVAQAARFQDAFEALLHSMMPWTG